MRRIVAIPILFALLIGLGALSALAADLPEQADSQLVSIHMRDASVQDVVQTIMTASGATIVLGDVTGHITLNLDGLPVERVLDIICTAKGYHWWRDQEGVYFVSSQPRPAPSVEASVVPGVSEPQMPDKMSRMYHLQFLPPQYAAWLFGASDNPGPLPYDADAMMDVGSVLMPSGKKSFGSSAGLGELRGAGGGRGGGGGGGGGRGGGGGGGGGGRGGGGGGGVGGGFGGGGAGGGFAGGGALIDFLPPDIDAMIAFPVLNSILIHGTEESINELIDLIKMVDRKPQQIIVELQSVEVSTTFSKQLGVDWYYIAGNTTITPQGMGTGASIIVSYTPAGNPNFASTLTYLLETGRGRVVDAIRVSTMNLMPASNLVTTNYPWVTVGGIAGDPFRGTNIQTVSVTTIPITTSLYITPRINGDGTITMYIPYQKSSITGTVEVPTSNGNVEYPITTTSNLYTTVNVRDGETFVVGGAITKSTLESERRLPLLGNLPIIGDLLFTRKTNSVNDTETLIFITPRIVKEEAAPATLGPI